MNKQNEYFEATVEVFGLSEVASNELRKIKALGGLYKDTEPVLTLPDLSRHIHGKVHPVDNSGEETSPLLQPSPRSKKVYVADLSKDISDIWIGTLTHGAPYTPLYEGKTAIDVRTDDGKVLLVSKQWFKEVYLYDEDETLLTCRDIEFQEGDYIDLRKHTPEQIRHIAEYYNVYELEETLGELDVEGWIYLVWDTDNEFVAATSKSDLGDKEYTYDDIFYLEEI